MSVTTGSEKNKKIFTKKHAEFSGLNETNSQAVGVTPAAWCLTFDTVLSHIENACEQI